MGSSLYLLGTPRLEREGQTIHADTRKALAMIAYLAVHEGYQSRDTLAALLWAESSQAGARGALRRTLSVLHKALGGSGLQIEREAIALDSGGLWCDLLAFRAALAACASHGHAAEAVCVRCLAPLAEAVSHYRGDFLQGFTLRDSADFDRWQLQQSEHFRRLYAQALEKLVRLHVEQGAYPAALTYAQRWLNLDLLHEPAHRQLILLYAWLGQRSVALQQYRDCVRILDQELGVPPLEETTRLYQLALENKVRLPARSDSIQPALAEPSQPRAPSPEAMLPLVGRSAELRQMVESFRGLARGDTAGKTLVIEGEAGIGKTRLAAEFLATMAADGVATLLVRCYESESNLAYAPLIRTLRAALLEDHELDPIPDHWLREVARLLPELQTVRADLVPPVVTESVGAQSRLFEAVTQVFLLLAGDKPGILAFEDAQWADHASVDLLAYLLRRLIEQRHFVLLTWRTGDVARTHRLQTMLLEHTGSGGETTVLRLARLEIQAVRDLVDRLNLANGEQLAQSLYQESEGLPLFLAAFLVFIRGDTPTPDTFGWSLPLGIQELLRARLMVLSETARQLLSAAAVIGRVFDVDLLREASGRSEEETVDGLDELLQRGLIQGVDDNLPAYEFYHEKLRALLCEEMSMARRRLLHRRTAEALLQRARHADQSPTFCAQVAYHFQHSGQEEEAAEYFYQAGIGARGLFANHEALLYFETALALSYPDAALLHQNMGDLYTLLGDYDAAIRSYEAALARGGSGTTSQLEHRLAKVYHRLGEWELAESYYRPAFEGLAQEQGSARAAVLADWSLTAYNRDAIARAWELAQRALTIADLAGDSRARAQAHNMMGILARRQGELDTASFHLKSSLEIAAALNEISMHIAALNNLALTLVEGGKFDEAQRLFDEALRLCTKLGDRHHEAALHNNLADLFHTMKQPQLAMVHLKQAVSIFAQIGVDSGAMKPEIWRLAEW